MSLRPLVPLAIGLVTVVVFQPTLGGAFLNWDDNVNFLGNPAYRGLGWAQLQWAFTSVLFGHYIPLTRLTWSLNYVAGGLDPWGYHLANLLLHAVNAILFFFVARRLLAAAAAGGSQRGHRDPAPGVGAAVAALVFGIHPLRVEPVAWITARADPLCALFALLTVWLHLRSVADGRPARPVLTWAAAATLGAALLSKGAALPVLGVLFLLDVYPLRRLRPLGWWVLVREKIPLLLVTAAGAAVIVYAVRHGAVLTQMTEHGVAARLAAAAHSFVILPLRLFWPSALSPLYEMPFRIDLADPSFAGAIVGVVLITAGLIGVRKRWPAGLAAWTFSILMLAPTSAIVRQGTDLAPDRYTYLAGLGFALLVGGAVLQVSALVRGGTLTPAMGRAVALAGLISLAGLGVASWSYCQVWKDSETLWRWATEIDPTCSVCQGKLGESILGGPAGAARAAEAEPFFRRAIALRSDLPDAYFNLGTALVIQGRYAEAAAPMRTYMERVPDSVSGPERLGLVYLLEGRFEAAAPLLREALVHRPDLPGLRAYLAQALEGQARALQAQGRGGEAEQLLAEARTLAASAPGPASPSP